MIHLQTTYNEDIFTKYVKDKYDFDGKGKVHVYIPSVNISFLENNKWNIFLILGRSGSGKSTILKEIREKFHYTKTSIYDDEKPIVSQFSSFENNPEYVCNIFNSVGLSSVPTWLHKPCELSNGEMYRFELASLFINNRKDEFIVVDEFTSVVNRDVAKSMAFSINKLVRQADRKMIIASCHYDIIEYLNPDYILDLNKQCQGICKIEHLCYNKMEIPHGARLSSDRKMH